MARRSADGQRVVMPDPLLLTAAEHARYRSELRELYHIRDRDLPRLLRDARSFAASDATEEMMQIEDDHAVVQARIEWLEELLGESTIVADDADERIATLGRAVEVEYLRTGRMKTFVLAGSAASRGAGTVSARSPVGRALMGRTSGDVVAVELPGGRTEQLRVVAVRPAPSEAEAA
jgi:transcription elongation factor GreA